MKCSVAEAKVIRAAILALLDVLHHDIRAATALLDDLVLEGAAPAKKASAMEATLRQRWNARPRRRRRAPVARGTYAAMADQIVKLLRAGPKEGLPPRQLREELGGLTKSQWDYIRKHLKQTRQARSVGARHAARIVLTRRGEGV